MISLVGVQYEEIVKPLPASCKQRGYQQRSCGHRVAPGPPGKNCQSGSRLEIGPSHGVYHPAPFSAHGVAYSGSNTTAVGPCRAYVCLST